MLIQVNKKVDYIKLYEQYSTLLNTKLQRKKAKCVYKQQDKQTENIFESDTNLEAKISYEDQQELEQLNQREKYNQIQTNVQILQGEKNQIENQRNQIEDLNNSYDSDEVVLDINTQQLIQFVKECDNQNKNWANQTNQREDEQISGSNKYQKIQDTLHKFQQIKNSKQVIVDILKEGIHHSQLQYSKYLYNGKQVNKQQEACQICKQPICESTEENSKHQQQQKNKLEGKIFFILCKHSFHKHCILLSPNYSQNFKYNQCPICANYQFLQDLPASSFF